MKIVFSNKAEKNFDKLPLKIKKKTLKQFRLIDTDIHHSSLQTKKLKGTNYFEARIDYHYRFVFRVEDESLYIISLGTHDEGLGKK
ncbi:MAG: hypothetical protein ACD_12C00109G0005 [uncultured bacterium]|nr:MAG: hypothetical protein ACD_12C00109G0005 [uncultured bacterium]